MLGSSFGNRLLTAERFPIIVGETLTAVEDVIASLGLCLRQAESLLHRVNRVLRNSAVRSPLAAHDADQSTRRVGFDHIIARQSLCIAGTIGSQGGSGAGKAADDVVWSDPSGQVSVEMPQQILNIFLSDYQLGTWQDLFVGGSDEQSSSPWNRKENA